MTGYLLNQSKCTFNVYTKESHEINLMYLDNESPVNQFCQQSRIEASNTLNTAVTVTGKLISSYGEGDFI